MSKQFPDDLNKCQNLVRDYWRKQFKSNPQRGSSALQQHFEGVHYTESDDEANGSTGTGDDDEDYEIMDEKRNKRSKCVKSIQVHSETVVETRRVPNEQNQQPAQFAPITEAPKNFEHVRESTHVATPAFSQVQPQVYNPLTHAGQELEATLPSESTDPPETLQALQQDLREEPMSVSIDASIVLPAKLKIYQGPSGNGNDCSTPLQEEQEDSEETQGEDTQQEQQRLNAQDELQKNQIPQQQPQCAQSNQSPIMSPAAGPVNTQSASKDKRSGFVVPCGSCMMYCSQRTVLGHFRGVHRNLSISTCPICLLDLLFPLEFKEHFKECKLSNMKLKTEIPLSMRVKPGPAATTSSDEEVEEELHDSDTSASLVQTKKRPAQKRRSKKSNPAVKRRIQTVDLMD